MYSSQTPYSEGMRVNSQTLDMGDRADTILSDIETVTGGKSPEEIFEKFKVAVRRFGFDKILFGQAFFIADKDYVGRRFFFEHGFADFMKLYAKENYQFSDPINLRIMQTHRPFRWREAHVGMSNIQMEQVAAAQNHGLKFGMVVPIMGQAGPTGFVSLGRDTDFKLTDRAFLELELLCRYAYMAIDRHYEVPDETHGVTLTPRESAILMHVSRGKTNWETGQILGISEYSVRDYLKSLSVRLETSNRTHTVVRAIQLGLILP